jgi:hypothetical protein
LIVRDGLSVKVAGVEHDDVEDAVGKARWVDDLAEDSALLRMKARRIRDDVPRRTAQQGTAAEVVAGPVGADAGGATPWCVGDRRLTSASPALPAMVDRRGGVARARSRATEGSLGTDRGPHVLMRYGSQRSAGGRVCRLSYNLRTPYPVPVRCSRRSRLTTGRGRWPLPWGPFGDHTSCLGLNFLPCRLAEERCTACLTCRNAHSSVLGVKGSQVQILSSRHCRPDTADKGRYSIIGCRLCCFYQQ